MTGRAWSLALALCVVAAGGPLVRRAGEAPAHTTTDRLARRLVTDIVAGRNAGRALCQLYSLRRYYGRPRYEPTPCTTETIRTIAASPDGDRTVYAAVTAPTWKPESPEGVLAFFDDRGFLLPVFAGANMVSATEALFEHRPGHRAVALDVSTATTDRGSDEYETVLVLHIVPVARSQQPLLSVIVGPPKNDICQGPGWGWRMRDTDGDRVPEIEIGPQVDASGTIAPRAVYRWAADAGGYVGPDGSPADGFQRTDRLSRTTECCSHHVRDFAQAVRALASTPEPGISRDTCEHSTFDMSTAF